MWGGPPWSARVPLDPLVADEIKPGKPTGASAADRGEPPHKCMRGGRKLKS
jgi:hypothetical protein